MLSTLVEKALHNIPPTREEAYHFLILPPTRLADILRAASEVRRHFKGDTVVLCTIINAKSGRCSEDCIFCAQSAYHATNIAVWPLKPAAEIAAAARANAPVSSYFGIVTSGHSPDEYELAAIEKTLQYAAAGAFPQKPCASLGILSEAAFARLKAAGLRRYHHNLETARSFFPRLCTTHTYDERVATVRAAQRAGLETCVGGIFGVGESLEERAELLFEIRELGPDSVPLNFLVPIPGTPVGDRSLLSLFEAVKIIALTRFILPDKDIKVAGGRLEVFGGDQALVFLAGANSIITGDLLTVKGRHPEDDLRLIANLGLRPVSE